MFHKTQSFLETSLLCYLKNYSSDLKQSYSKTKSEKVYFLELD